MSKALYQGFSIGTENNLVPGRSFRIRAELEATANELLALNNRIDSRQQVSLAAWLVNVA